MKTVAFVPIKLNNERLPGKNIKPFTNGKPLVHYIFQTLMSVKEIDEIYVYCSSEEIVKYVPSGVIFLKRDPYLDLSTTSFNEVLTTFAEKVDVDVYILTHATAPFISAESFKKGIQAVKSGNYDSALSVEKMQEFMWKDNKPFNYAPERIPRTQDLEPFFIETCGMYIYTKAVISEKHRRIGDNPYLVEVDKVESTDINNPEDFLLADAIFNSQLKK